MQCDGCGEKVQQVWRSADHKMPTIREFLAAEAINGILSSTDWDEGPDDGKNYVEWFAERVKTDAKIAVQYADALIEELRKPKESKP